MKKIIILVNFILFFLLVSCGKSNSTSNKSVIDNFTTTKEGEVFNMKLILNIGDKEVDASWEDNDSVKALMNLANFGITINMSRYGGFEQVGSIGSTLPAADNKIITSPGDIVLYSSNQIVIFYGSNTWSYTKLGHINLSKSELTELLSVKDVVITLNLK